MEEIVFSRCDKGLTIAIWGFAITREMFLITVAVARSGV